MDTLRAAVPSRQCPTADIPTSEPHLSLSGKLWQIVWSDHFPVELLNTQVSLEISSFEEANLFATRHFAAIYGESPDRSRFLWLESSPARQRYYQIAGDFFSFRDKDGNTLGIALGGPSDWGTYYVRNVSLLPSAQGKGLYQAYLIRLIECLSAYRVDRVEVDVSPDNFANVHTLNKLRFCITAFHASERWGALVRFTRFLNDRNETVFARQFCQGVRSRTSSPPKGEKERRES